jgi:hypothetical protein
VADTLCDAWPTWMTTLAPAADAVAAVVSDAWAGADCSDQAPHFLEADRAARRRGAASRHPGGERGAAQLARGQPEKCLDGHFAASSMLTCNGPKAVVLVQNMTANAPCR